MKRNGVLSSDLDGIKKKGDGMTTGDLIALNRVLTEHDYRYYILFGPIISDYEYDKLDREYSEAIEKFITQKIGKRTRSLERSERYPQWVRDEFKGIKSTL